MRRRKFLKKISFLSIVSNSCSKTIMDFANKVSEKENFQFVVSSDLHYGDLTTNYTSLMDNFSKEIQKYNSNNTIDFFILNGDIIHDNPMYLPLVRSQLDNIGIQYYVNRGNHDMVSKDLWQLTWGKNLNYVLDHKGVIFIFLDSSNINGEYLSPDLVWLEAKLNLYSKSSIIFLIIHIPQVKLTQHAIENPAFVNLVSKYVNIKGIFHGHEHDLDGIIYINNIPCQYDSHLGGRWGTSYNGFRVVEVNERGFITYMHDYINNKKKNIESFYF
jgi:hypothetical protein